MWLATSQELKQPPSCQHRDHGDHSAAVAYLAGGLEHELRGRIWQAICHISQRGDACLPMVSRVLVRLHRIRSKIKRNNQKKEPRSSS